MLTCLIQKHSDLLDKSLLSSVLTFKVDFRLDRYRWNYRALIKIIFFRYLGGYGGGGWNRGYGGKNISSLEISNTKNNLNFNSGYNRGYYGGGYNRRHYGGGWNYFG